MEALKLSLYPRGFFGEPIATTLRPKVRPFAGRNTGRPQTIELYQPVAGELVGSPEVMRLYKMWFNGDPYTRSFDYRREVMTLASTVFGTLSFLEWFRAQQMSPAYGEWHHRFLTDTLRYIQTGKRDLDIRTWMRMVTFKDEPISDYDPGGYVEQYFGKRRLHPDTVVALPNHDSEPSLIYSLQKWLAQPQGLDDLLNSLYLLFGELN